MEHWLRPTWEFPCVFVAFDDRVVEQGHCGRAPVRVANSRPSVGVQTQMEFVEAAVPLEPVRPIAQERPPIDRTLRQGSVIQRQHLDVDPVALQAGATGKLIAWVDHRTIPMEILWDVKDEIQDAVEHELVHLVLPTATGREGK